MKANYEELEDMSKYSTSETKIGTWINGKPLYRKVCVFQNLTYGSTANAAHNISDVEEIFIENAFLCAELNLSRTRPFMGLSRNGAAPDLAKDTLLQAYISFISYFIGTAYQDSGKQLVVILNYTKTTD